MSGEAHMSSTIILPVVAQLLLPLMLLAWVASPRHSSRLSLGLAILITATWILGIDLAGMWLILPWYLPLAYGAALAALAARTSRAIRDRPGRVPGRRATARLVVQGASLASVGIVVIAALAGRRVPGSATDLAPPLRGGTHLVVNGGSNALVNAHLATLADEPRYRPWRGQSYGVDLVRLGPRGFRARGVVPGDPAAYEAFGDTILAPCGGRVVAATDGLADLVVPRTDRSHMAGNHLLLECGPVWVLLGHMQNGSVRPRVNERVRVGQVVGLVGNTGNTGEPHLHLHAQRPGTAAVPLGGEPVPITIRDEYLVRNARPRW
jgi:hypothetical protein